MSPSRFFPIVTGLVAVLALPGTATAQPPAADWIEGDWRAVSTVVGGQSPPVLTIQGDLVKFEFDGGPADGRFFFETRIIANDPDQDPAHLDLRFERTNVPPQHAGENIGKVAQAVYRVDGDQLTLLMAQPDSGRRPDGLDPGQEGVEPFAGSRIDDGTAHTMDDGLPAELAGAWRHVEPMVLRAGDGLLAVGPALGALPFYQYEVLEIGFDPEGVGRVDAVVLQSGNRAFLGKTVAVRVVFADRDTMTCALYPPGHPMVGRWPETTTPSAAADGLLIATWERIQP